MRYSDDDLSAAAAAGVIAPADLENLRAFLAARQPSIMPAPVVRFDVATLLWYAGALIVIGAMGLFSTLAFSAMGGRALAGTAFCYAIAFAFAGHYLWHHRNLKIPGGLLICVAVSMAPLAVYGIQDELDWWGQFGKPGTVQGFYVWIKGSWIFMEIAAILAGVVALYFYRFPFIVALIAVALWFMSMDLAPWLATGMQSTWDLQRKVSIWFGLAVIVIAWITDTRASDRGYAFWLHLFGLMAFWGGVTASDGAGEVAKAVYAALNVGLLLLSVFLERRVYAVFGTVGLCIYLGHLADVVFKNSLLFPFVLSLIGVAVIGLGLLYHRKQAAFAAFVTARLPDSLRRLRPAHAQH